MHTKLLTFPINSGTLQFCSFAFFFKFTFTAVYELQYILIQNLNIVNSHYKLLKPIFSEVKSLPPEN